MSEEIKLGTNAIPLNATPETALWCMTNDVYSHARDLELIKDLIFAIDFNEVEETGCTENYLRTLQLALESVHAKMTRTADIGLATFKSYEQKNKSA